MPVRGLRKLTAPNARLTREAADPLHCPDVTLKALVRGGELKVDDLGDLTYSVDRVLVLGPSPICLRGPGTGGHVSALQFATATAGSRSAQRR